MVHTGHPILHKTKKERTTYNNGWDNLIQFQYCTKLKHRENDNLTCSAWHDLTASMMKLKSILDITFTVCYYAKKGGQRFKINRK